MKLFKSLFLVLFLVFSSSAFAAGITDLFKLLISGSSSLEVVRSAIESQDYNMLSDDVKKIMIETINKANLEDSSNIEDVKLNLLSILTRRTSLSTNKGLSKLEKLEILYYNTISEMAGVPKYGRYNYRVDYLANYNEVAVDLIKNSENYNLGEFEKNKIAYFSAMIELVESKTLKKIRFLNTEYYLSDQLFDSFFLARSKAAAILREFSSIDNRAGRAPAELLTQNLDGKTLSLVLELLHTGSLGLNKSGFLFKTSPYRFLYFLNKDMALTPEAKLLIPVYAVMTDIKRVNEGQEIKATISFINFLDLLTKYDAKDYIGEPLNSFFKNLSITENGLVTNFVKKIIEKAGENKNFLDKGNIAAISSMISFLPNEYGLESFFNEFIKLEQKEATLKAINNFIEFFKEFNNISAETKACYLLSYLDQVKDRTLSNEEIEYLEKLFVGLEFEKHSNLVTEIQKKVWYQRSIKAKSEGENIATGVNEARFVNEDFKNANPEPSEAAVELIENYSKQERQETVFIEELNKLLIKGDSFTLNQLENFKNAVNKITEVDVSETLGLIDQKKKDLVNKSLKNKSVTVGGVINTTELIEREAEKEKKIDARKGNLVDAKHKDITIKTKEVGKNKK